MIIFIVTKMMDIILVVLLIKLIIKSSSIIRAGQKLDSCLVMLSIPEKP